VPVGGGLSFLLSYFLVVRDMSVPVCRLNFRWSCHLLPDVSVPFGGPLNFQRRWFIGCDLDMPVGSRLSSLIEWLLIGGWSRLLVSFRSRWIRLPSAA
jgi:hypothetical protein